MGTVVALALPFTGASAEVKAPQTVWAKSGVSYDQYRADALECGMQGLARNIDNSEAVEKLKQASQQLEAIDADARAAQDHNANQMGIPGRTEVYVYNGLDIAAEKAAREQMVRAAARPEEQYARIKQMMFETVRNCMIRGGYIKIVLTEDQRTEYSRIKGGADARRVYIHQLASDPDVLETQRQTGTQ